MGSHYQNPEHSERSTILLFQMLFCTNGVSLFTVKEKGILSKPDIIILFALQPGDTNVLACFLLKVKGEQG